MSGMKLRLMCLVWPDDKPDEHIVQVEIDDDDTCGFSQGYDCKYKHAPMLDEVAGTCCPQYRPLEVLRMMIT
jgi:hypothetical protein